MMNMYHRIFLPLLLSLALLASQQLGFAHAFSHVDGENGRPAVSEAERKPGSTKMLADNGCLHCPAYAQLAFALIASYRHAQDPGLGDAFTRAMPSLARGATVPVYYLTRAPPGA